MGEANLTPGELLLAAHKEVLDSYRREFEQLATAFRDVDAKAQGTAVLAGGFLAAALAFVSHAGALTLPWSRALAGLSVVGFVMAIGFSIAALRVRAVAGPPSAADMALLLRDLGRVADPRELAERLPFFYGDAAELWRGCSVTRRAVNLEKAALVSRAQHSLVAAAACVTLLIVVYIVAA